MTEPTPESDPPTDEQMHEWFPRLFGWIDDELEALEGDLPNE